MTFPEFILAQRHELLVKTMQHLLLTGVSAGAAIAAGVPLGILIARCHKLRGPVLGVAGVIQTIPSVALLALLMIPLGLGLKPAIGALFLYALLPIIVNSYTGLVGVDHDILEAADAMGFTSRQRLWRVELPLAAPVIIAGIRTASVITVGIATLSALIGAGGLGDFIFRGISTSNRHAIMLGVLAASTLALLLGYVIGLFEKFMQRKLHLQLHQDLS